jgi:ATP-binding cassette, subfamily B, multidrug efflux pump
MAAPPARSTIAPEAVLGKAYDARLMAKVWQFVKPHWRMLIAALAMMPTAVAFELAQPYVLKEAIDKHITQGKLDGLGTLAALFVVLVGLQALANFAQLYALTLLGQRSMRDLRVRLYGHVLAQRSAFFDRTPVGRLLTRMTSDIENINEMFAAGVITLVADVIKLTAIVGMMFYLHAELALVTFITLPFLIAVVEYARRLMRKSFREIRVKLAAMNAFLAEHLAGLKVVQLFTREQQALADFNQLNRDHRNAYLGAIRADVSLYALVEALGVVAVASVAWYASGQIGSGALTVGLVVAFIEYINKFFIPVRDLSAKYTVMQSAMAATERIFGLLDTDEPDAPVRAGPPVPSSPSAGTPAIEFKDVEFGYRAEEPVLRGLSLAVPRGQTVAVVGPTGSGKSTIIKLLTRLYEPTGGQITLYGRPLTDISAAEARHAITVISQDVFLFAGSVLDNVALGNPNAAPDLISSAMRRVGADTMLARRKGPGAGPVDPSRVQVDERGANFSAGERQLIAFARALVRDPSILVLDEATAHVDPEAETLIEAGLAELMADRTTLVIAHRLSTVRRADRIVVVVRGQIVEQGTHDQLLAAGGAYARLEGTVIR